MEVMNRHEIKQNMTKSTPVVLLRRILLSM